MEIKIGKQIRTESAVAGYCEPHADGAITQALMGLSGTLSELVSVADRLESRLRDVVSAQSPVCESVSPERAVFSSPLHERVSSMNDTASLVAVRLQSILSRIDL